MKVTKITPNKPPRDPLRKAGRPLGDKIEKFWIPKVARQSSYTHHEFKGATGDERLPGGLEIEDNGYSSRLVNRKRGYDDGY
jgi:hypothetical protein